MTRAALLIALSDERDRWVRFALDWARSAYRSGYADGHRSGYRFGYELAVREWKITAAGMTDLGGRSFAELDRRRYPPGGRLTWIIPGPARTPGGSMADLGWPASYDDDGNPVDVNGRDGQPGSRVDELRGALIDSAGLDKLPVPGSLIDGLLVRDSLAWLHGKPGHCKTLIALDWSCCVGAGLPWQGRAVTAGPVLYVIAEGTSGLQARVRAWEDNAGERTTVWFLPVAIQLRMGDFPALAALAAELGCSWSSTPRLASRSAPMRTPPSTWGNSWWPPRGSGRTPGRAFCSCTTRRGPVRTCAGRPRSRAPRRRCCGSSRTGSRITLTNPKQKDAVPADTFHGWVVPHLQSVIVAAQPMSDSPMAMSASELAAAGWPRRELAAELAAAGVPAAQVAARLGVHPSTVRKWRRRAAGLLRSVTRGNAGMVGR